MDDHQHDREGRCPGCQIRYELDDVARFMGTREGRPEFGGRHVTVADILTWAADPGGSQSYYLKALEEGEEDAWMARRGPLDPNSRWGTVLWDFLRAVKALKGPAMRRRTKRELEQLWSAAIVVLRSTGFTHQEIGELKGVAQSTITERVLGRETGRKYVGAYKVERIVHGGGLWFPILSRRQVVVRDGGLVRKTTELMNGSEKSEHENEKLSA